MNDKNDSRKANRKITVSAPGRLCLFGEHQDYLGLPVVAAPMDLRARFTASPNSDGVFRVEMPDIGESIEIDPSTESACTSDRDYLRSGVNVMLKEGFRFGEGYDVTLKSNIPVGKGCASSSAIQVAWTGLLERMATEGRKLSVGDLADIAYRAEVVEFGEPGGMMDHFTSAFGGILLIKTTGNFGAVDLADELPGCFVLGDSLEGKDTTGTLARARSLAEEAFSSIRRTIKNADWHTISGAEAKRCAAGASTGAQKALAAALAGRDITRDALKLFESGSLMPETLGALMTEHHEYLSRYLGVSTEKIDAMALAALEAGAFGAKINGSGGGGCMFAYTDEERADAVAAAIESASGRAVRIALCGGIEEETQ